MILLSDILKIKTAKFYGDKKQLLKNFNYVTIDSRKANSNDVFIAIAGENFDAHNFLQQVFESGTQLAIVNKKWFNKNHKSFTKNNFVVVDDTVLGLGSLANVHRERLKTKVIAVGGSNGKTSTKEMLHAALSTKYNTLKTDGNFNNHIGVPLTLLRLKKEHKYAVVEVGCNHFDEIKYLCEVANPDFGLITNIGKEHLEFFKNKAGVAKAELEMFDYLKKKKDAICFVNADDDYLRKYAEKNLKAKNTVSYAFKQKATGTAIFKGFNDNFNPEISFSFQKNKFDITVSTFGMPGALNALCVATVATQIGIKAKDIQKALSNFVTDSSKRMEVWEGSGIRVINDTYNSNPDSVKLGFDTLKHYKGNGKKLVAFGDMLELGKVGEAEHAAIGTYFEKCKLDTLYAFGPLSKSISKGAKSKKNIHHFADKNIIIEKLSNSLKSGDLLYVKGSRGMKMEDVVVGLSGKFGLVKKG